MEKSGSGGLGGAAASPREQRYSSRTQTSQTSLVACKDDGNCTRRCAPLTAVFARSGPSDLRVLAPRNLQRCLHVCSAPNRTKMSGAFGFAADATIGVTGVSYCARGVGDLSATRCYGSGRRTLPQPASLARAARAKLPIQQRPSVVFEHTTPKREMDNIMYLYEQLGPPDAAPKPRRRRRMEVLVV